MHMNWLAGKHLNRPVVRGNLKLTICHVQNFFPMFYAYIMCRSVIFLFHSIIHSPIYCTGEILHTVQMAKIFNDSKTFVDMKLKQSSNRTIQLFKEFMAKHSDTPSREDVRKFVNVSEFVFHLSEIA